MQILRDKSQMSTLFAPTGAGDTDWNHSKTSIEVSFDGFIRSADKADQCRSRRDVKGLDREVEKGSNAQKVTEWKPAFLRRQGTSPESTGLLPPWFESRSWLTKLKRTDAEVFRPKFALMQAGACTEHHRDNYGTLTWIKVLGGSQLLATWNMNDGDSTPELSDNSEEHDEEFPWKTFAQLPSARLVFLDVGDVFFMRPGVYHRVFTLSAKVQLFGEFVGAATFVESLKSAKADRERPHCLKACDSRITMTLIVPRGPRCGTGRGRGRSAEGGFGVGWSGGLASHQDLAGQVFGPVLALSILLPRSACIARRSRPYVASYVYFDRLKRITHSSYNDPTRHFMSAAASAGSPVAPCSLNIWYASECSRKARPSA